MKNTLPTKLTLATTLVAALALATSTTRAEGPAPTAQELMEKSIQAAGGREKLAAVKSVSLAGTLAAPAMGINGTLSVKSKPGNTLMIATLGDAGEIRMGANKDVVYSYSDMQGARLITGEEAKLMRDTMNPVRQATRFEKLKDIRVAGSEKVGDADAWKLVGKTEAGADEAHWLDAKTYLPVRLTTTVPTQMGPIETDITMSDYQSFDGVQIPMTTEQNARGTRMVMTFKDVKINPELPDADFKLPEEVQKLADKQAAKNAADANGGGGASTQPAGDK